LIQQWYANAICVTPLPYAAQNSRGKAGVDIAALTRSLFRILFICRTKSRSLQLAVEINNRRTHSPQPCCIFSECRHGAVLCLASVLRGVTVRIFARNVLPSLTDRRNTCIVRLGSMVYRGIPSKTSFTKQFSCIAPEKQIHSKCSFLIRMRQEQYAYEMRIFEWICCCYAGHVRKSEDFDETTYNMRACGYRAPDEDLYRVRSQFLSDSCTMVARGSPANYPSSPTSPLISPIKRSFPVRLIK
jgi:hypothetical protein